MSRGPLPLSLVHCVFLTALVLGIGALIAYVITRDSAVLSWATGMVGTAFGTAIGAGTQPKP